MKIEKEDTIAKILLCGGCEVCKYYTNHLSHSWPPKLEDMFKDLGIVCLYSLENREEFDDGDVRLYSTKLDERGCCENWEKA